MEDPLLLQAWRLHLKGQPAAAIGLLEPQILKYRSHSDFYRILGLCCLRQGDWKGGETYLSRSLQLDPEERVQVLLALTAVYAKRQDYGEAVRLALEVLDLDPSCQPAKKGLAKLRLALSEESRRVSTKDLMALLPRVRTRQSRVSLAALVGLVLVVFSVVGIWLGWILVQGMFPPANLRPGPLATLVPDSNLADAPSTAGPTKVTLTNDQVRQTLNKIRQLFQDYQDSTTRLEINRILLSNASTVTKERVRSLIPFLHDPDFTRNEVTAEYLQVQSFPELYEGCTVRWKGVISNLTNGTNEITFDLLLGYQDGQVVQGVIPVRLGFASLLKNSQVVEVLGLVVLQTGKWSVEGKGLHIVSYRAP